jgi:hypothetical protein
MREREIPSGNDLPQAVLNYLSNTELFEVRS